MSRPALSFYVLLCLLSQSASAQNCPTVPELLDLLYERPDAVAATEQFVRRRCAGAGDSLAAAFHQRSVYAFSSGEPLGVAIEYAQLALGVQRTLYRDSLRLPLAKSLANLGLFYRNDRQHRTAEPYLLEAEAAYRTLDLYPRRHNVREQLVFLWQATGDFGRARETLTLMAAEAEREAAPWNEADVARLFGRLYNEMGDYAAAQPYLERAVAAFTELGSAEWAAQARQELSRSHYHRGQYARAATLARAALATNRELGREGDVAGLENLLGLISLRAGRPAAAATYLQAARTRAENLNDPFLTAVALDNEAELALDRGQAELAVTKVRTAIRTLVPTWSPGPETPLPTAAQLAGATDRPGLFGYLGDLARALLASGRPAAAREALATADGLADQLRADFGTSVSQLFWRREALPVYDLALRLSHRAGDAATAFYYLEKSRSILLLSALLREDADAGLPDSLSARVTGRTREVRHYERQLLTAAPATHDSLRARLATARTALADLRRTLAGEYPRLQELIVTPPVLPLAEARAQIRAEGWDHQLTFFLGGDTAYVFDLTATTAELHALGPVADLERDVRALLTYFTGPAAIDQDPAGYLRLAHALYRRLFAPLPLTAGERLLLLPDGLLAYLPFPALVTNADASTLATADFLLAAHPTAYAQSATVLHRQRAGDGGATDPATALGAFPFPEAPEGGGIPALPFSAEEVGQLADRYPTTVLAREAASRNRLLELLGTTAIAHLSTHAFASPSGGEPPRILTADEPLYLPDVYGLRLDCALVALSACQSNIGPLAEGEGVLGLGRAFAVAGARGVVASLWTLNDRATAAVVGGFYDQLAAGVPKPLALHRAQLAYLQRTDLPAYAKSPYYWAGLTYYGTAGRLPGRDGVPWWLWLVAGAGLLVLFATFRRRAAT